MRIATTTGTLGSPSPENLKKFYDAGYRYLDLGIWNGMVMRPDYKEFARSVKEAADALGLKFVQSHAPDGNALDPKDFDRYVETTIHSIEFCAEIGIPCTVVHTGYEKFITKEDWFKRNKEFYEKLFPTMEKTGVYVLAENSTSANMGHKRYFTNSGAEMREFVEYVDHPLVRICWDTGHANCEGNQYDDIMAMGELLYALHVHDNRGNDEHCSLYTGNINMDDVMNALIDSGYKGYFTYETGCTMHGAGYRHAPRRVFERDTRLLNPPAFVTERFIEFDYEVAEYILKAYDVFEE